MIRTMKTLSLLLSYPSEQVRQGGDAMMIALKNEGLVTGVALDGLGRFVTDFSGTDLYDLQERYVYLFDRTRSLSLHLFEHVHGESRDRGQAMVDLIDVYAQHGLNISAKELPDHLPLFLEFLSILTPEQAHGHLAEIGHIVEGVRQRLVKKDSAYAAVFGALASLCETPADSLALRALEPGDDDPDDLQALDQLWQDEAIDFGGGAAGSADSGGACPADRAQPSQVSQPIKMYPSRSASNA